MEVPWERGDYLVWLVSISLGWTVAGTASLYFCSVFITRDYKLQQTIVYKWGALFSLYIFLNIKNIWRKTLSLYVEENLFMCIFDDNLNKLSF